MKALADLILMEIYYQQDCARERRLWLNRVSMKPLVYPTREKYARTWFSDWA